MPKKTYNEKLNNPGDLPKVEFISPENNMAERFGSGNMVVAAPLEYDEIMRRIPKGKLVTADEVRAFLAKKHNADFTCQLTAGIFMNIAANASKERESMGSSDTIPYWRTLKKNGELNEKYPGGVDQQKFMLELEGHEIVKKGTRYFVKDYTKALYQL